MVQLYVSQRGTAIDNIVQPSPNWFSRNQQCTAAANNALQYSQQKLSPTWHGAVMVVKIISQLKMCSCVHGRGIPHLYQKPVLGWRDYPPSGAV